MKLTAKDKPERVALGFAMEFSQNLTMDFALCPAKFCNILFIQSR